MISTPNPRDKVPVEGLDNAFYVPIETINSLRASRPIRQCFRLDGTMIEAMPWDQIQAMVDELEAHDLFKPPYQEFRIEFVCLIEKSASRSQYIIVLDYYIEDPAAPVSPDQEMTIVSKLYRDGKFVEPWDYPALSSGSSLLSMLDRLGPVLYKTLICLLATRNIEKRVSHSKLARFGVGKQKTEYVTTLHIGAMQTERTKGEGEAAAGGPLRPHWRRGHSRLQHYGPRGSMTKKIWIEPVFVNSDAEYTGGRAAYNVIR